MSCVGSFTDYEQTSYCEANLAIRNLFGEGSSTEIGNVITSLMISYYAAYVLWKSHRGTDPISRMILGVLFCNGIGSALFHGVGMVGLSQSDGLTMLLLVGLGMNSLFTEMVHTFAHVEKRSRWKNFVAFLTMFYLTCAIIAQQFSGSGAIVYQILFGLPLFMFLVALVYLHYEVKKFLSPKAAIEDVDQLMVLIKITIGTGVGSFVCWLIDLLACDATKYAVVFGHWIWHIGIGYFATCIIAIVTYLRGDTYGLYPNIEYPVDTAKGKALAIFRPPICTYDWTKLDGKSLGRKI